MATYFDACQIPNELASKIRVSSLPNAEVEALVYDLVSRDGDVCLSLGKGDHRSLHWAMTGQLYGDEVESVFSDAIYGGHAIDEIDSVRFLAPREVVQVAEALRVFLVDGGLLQELANRVEEWARENSKSSEEAGRFHNSLLTGIRRLEGFYRAAAACRAGVGITIG